MELLHGQGINLTSGKLKGRRNCLRMMRNERRKMRERDIALSDTLVRSNSEGETQARPPVTSLHHA